VEALAGAERHLGRAMAEKMLHWTETPTEHRRHALLYLCYAFLLRLPSEALPAHVARGKEHVTGHAVLGLRGGSLELRLRLRKNRPEGSTLTCGCWRRESPTTCPLHVLGPLGEACGAAWCAWCC